MVKTADNVAITAGAGTSVATDDEGGVHYQKVKLADGASGATTAIAAGAGVKANALRVTIATDDGLVKAEDAAHSSADTGIMALGVRKDTAAALAGTDGDYAPLEVDANGRLHVLDPSTAAIKTAVEVIDNAIAGTEMQVDVVASLPAGTNAIGKLAANSGVDIGDVDVISVVPGTAATNLGKAEDAAHTSGDVGVMGLAVRKDAGASFAGTDGDYAPLQLDANGNLRVNIAAGAAAGGTSATDEADYTPTASSGTPIMGAVDEAAPDTAAEGKLALVRATTYRALHVNLRDASGAEVAVGGGTQYDEDVAHTTGDKLTVAGVVRKDVAASLCGTDGDYTALEVDANGRLHVIEPSAAAIKTALELIDTVDNGTAATAQRVTIASDSTGQVKLAAGTAEVGKLAAGTAIIGKVGIDQTTPGTTNGVQVAAALPAGDNNIGNVDIASAIPAGNNNIGDVDVASVVPGTAATNLGKAEDAAHTSGDVGVMALAVRDDTLAAASGTEGDYEPLHTNNNGALFVETVPGTMWVAFHDVAGGAHTDVELQAAPGAGLSLYVTDLIITNDATLATSVKLEEDTASAKTQKTAVMYIPASGGISVRFATPIKLTANKNLGFTTTGTANTSIEAHGYTAA